MNVNAGELKELRKEFNEKKKELSKLRFQLNSLSSLKEESFRGLRSSGDKVKSLLTKIKTLKSERDKLTQQVKEFKKERDHLNLAVKEKSDARREADQKRKELLGKFDSKEDPERIKSLIDKFEEKIETEVIPFSQEEKIRKQIKELKLQYNQAKGLRDVWKTINTTAVGFTETRRKAESSHKKVQELAQQSQKIHEQINKSYAEVKELRSQEQPLAKKYLDFKAQYEISRKSLEEVSLRVNELGKLFKEEDHKSFEKQVEERTIEVKDKIKRRQKLSTEDILAFQASKE